MKTQSQNRARSCLEKPSGDYFNRFSTGYSSGFCLSHAFQTLHNLAADPSAIAHQPESTPEPIDVLYEKMEIDHSGTFPY